ncbi:MAG: cyclic nucleotide-binding domain-containing protein [Rhodothermales bacterium]
MHGLWSNLFKPTSFEEETRALLKRTPIFASLSKRELDSIERIMYRRDYVAGEQIFHQGDPGIGMYIIQHGVVSIVQLPDQHELAELTTGDFFGEIALLNETPRSASAIARTECTLLGVGQPDLLGLFKRNSKLGVKVLIPLSQITGRRLVEIDQELPALHHRIAALEAENRRLAAIAHELSEHDALD